MIRMLKNQKIYGMSNIKFKFKQRDGSLKEVET